MENKPLHGDSQLFPPNPDFTEGDPSPSDGVKPDSETKNISEREESFIPTQENIDALKEKFQIELKELCWKYRRELGIYAHCGEMFWNFKSEYSQVVPDVEIFITQKRREELALGIVRLLSTETFDSPAYPSEL